MIEISTASVKDIPVIRELADKTWWATYGNLLKKEQIEYMLNTIYSPEAIESAMKNHSQTFLLLKEENVPMGFASYGPWAEKERAWKIHKLYVLPECHGKGFGRKLIDDIVTCAKARSISTIVLNVKRDNPAFNFYKKYGFTVLREEDIPLGPYWLNDYVMLLTI